MSAIIRNKYTVRMQLELYERLFNTVDPSLIGSITDSDAVFETLLRYVLDFMSSM